MGFGFFFSRSSNSVCPVTCVCVLKVMMTGQKDGAQESDWADWFGRETSGPV